MHTGKLLLASASTRGDCCGRMDTDVHATERLEIQETIEVDGVALVSLQDSKLAVLADDHEKFATYLNGFTTEFGQKIAPSVILVRKDKFELYRPAEAMAGFRDAIAMSIIPYSWAHVLRFENNNNIKYANWFAFIHGLLTTNTKASL